MESKYWFFGGSTTWGTGVNDELTYPSLFAKNTNHYVTNFGESGYIARQSLAYMINYITQNNLKNISDTHVVFYDGVNDVSHRCRSEIKGIATSREKQIQNSLSVQERFNFSKTFEQLIDFFSLIQIKLFKKEYKKNNSHNYYNCSNNNQRAYEIAETLVNTWEIASDYVISKGGKFTAILQPVSFYGKAQFDYLNLNNENDLNLASQYNKVYPLIINIAKKRNFNFVDLTSTYDGCSVCYIDFGHVGPQGHEILVKKLLKILN